MSLFRKKPSGAPAVPESLLTVDMTGMSEDEIARLEAKAVLEKYDKESAYRNRLPMPLARMLSII